MNYLLHRNTSLCSTCLFRFTLIFIFDVKLWLSLFIFYIFIQLFEVGRKGTPVFLNHSKLKTIFTLCKRARTRKITVSFCIKIPQVTRKTTKTEPHSGVSSLLTFTRTANTRQVKQVNLKRLLNGDLIKDFNVKLFSLPGWQQLGRILFRKWSTPLTTWFWAHIDTTPLEIEAMIGRTGCH